MIRLLLVDDHASFRWPLAVMLDLETDLSVVAQAGTLAEAREALRALEEASESVDVALIDLVLPDGEGTALIGDLRAANPRTYTLVLTGYSEREHFARAVEAGAAGVLNKASGLAEIVDAIRRLYSGERLIPLEETLEMVRAAVRARERDRDAGVALGRLTTRELEVLQALADGLGNKEISERLQVSVRTVCSHLTNILNKLGVESRLQALVLALRHGAVKVRRTLDDE